MPMQVMVDESGTKGTDREFVMAGLVGRAEDWALFSDEWDKTLKASPHIGYFKMYQADHRAGQFGGLSEPSRDEKLDALARVLIRYPFRALSVTVSVQGFVEQAPKDSLSRQQPYLVALPSYIGAACFDLWNRGERERFEIFFDDQPKMRKHVRRLYPKVVPLMPMPMRSILPIEPRFEDDKNFVALQAADMVAWFKHHRDSPDHDFRWIESLFDKHLEGSAESISFGPSWFDQMADAFPHVRARRDAYRNRDQ